MGESERERECVNVLYAGRSDMMLCGHACVRVRVSALERVRTRMRQSSRKQIEIFETKKQTHTETNIV